MIIWLLVSVLFIGAGSFLLRGGSRHICSYYFKRVPIPDKIPHCHYYGCALATLGFAAWVLINSLNPWLIPVFAIGWYLTIMKGWQSWFSIGKSVTVKRKEGYIGWVLHKIYGKPVYVNGIWVDTKWWRIKYDATGFFLRMNHSIALFIPMGLISSFSLYGLLMGFVATILFSAGTVVIYYLNNWVIPQDESGDGDNGLNYAEALTGALIMACAIWIV